MKPKRLSTLSILDGSLNSDAALSRTEMKQIIAGSGSSGDCWIPCDINQGWKICCCANGGGTCVASVSECWSYC